MSPWRFRAPLSPDMAAAREGRTVPFDDLVDHCRDRLAAAAGPLLIEGVGGAMVPLDECHTVLDWMAALALPALLVSGTYRSEEHTSELQSLMRISYAVSCLKNKTHTTYLSNTHVLV